MPAPAVAPGCAPSHLCQRLLQIGFDVVDVFDADGQAHHVVRHAGFLHFFGGELAVRGGGGVAGEAFAVAYVDQARDQFQGVLKARAAVAATLYAEGEDAGRSPAQILLRQRVFGVIGQAGVFHPADFGMVLEILRHGQRVGADALHAQGQGFDALQDEKAVEGRDGRAGIAQRHDAGAADEGGGA